MESIRELGEVISSLQSIPTMRTDLITNIEALKRNQLAMDDIDQDYCAERLQLEEKYLERRNLYYMKRRSLVNGDVAVIDEDGVSAGILKQL